MALGPQGRPVKANFLPRTKHMQVTFCSIFMTVTKAQVC